MTVQLYSKRAAATAALVCAVALAAAATASGGRTAGGAAARCKTSGLVVWLDTQGDAAAGSFFYKLRFTNQSGRRCTSPATRACPLSTSAATGSAPPHPASPPQHVQSACQRVRPRAPSFESSWPAACPQSACHRVPAAGPRVYRPNQAASKAVPVPFEACSRSGPVYLSAKAVAA